MTLGNVDVVKSCEWDMKYNSWIEFVWFYLEKLKFKSWSWRSKLFCRMIQWWLLLIQTDTVFHWVTWPFFLCTSQFHNFTLPFAFSQAPPLPPFFNINFLYSFVWCGVANNNMFWMPMICQHPDDIFCKFLATFGAFWGCQQIGLKCRDSLEKCVHMEDKKIL